MPGAASEIPCRRVSVGPLAVDVRTLGDACGRSVVLVHGIGMSSAYFVPFARVLGRQHRVHMLDLPGYGSTPKPSRPLDIPGLARVTACVVAELGLDRPILIGQSMGCQTVARALADHPDLASGYVLVGPTVDPRARSLVRQGLRLGRDMLLETPANNAVVIRDYLRMGPVRFLRTARAMLDDRIEEHVAACSAPGLVVRGSRDPIAPARWVYQLAASAPDARAAEVPEAAHNCQHTHPEALADICRPFLTRRDPPRDPRRP